MRVIPLIPKLYLQYENTSRPNTFPEFLVVPAEPEEERRLRFRLAKLSLDRPSSARESIELHGRFLNPERPESMGHILLVDDSSTVRLHMTQVLSHAGYQVRAVGSGKAALESYKAERAALVILDVVMPDMDGVETFQLLRSIDSHVKVLGISGMGPRFPTEYLKILGALGAQAVLEKPFSDEALLHLVKQTIDSGTGSNQVAT